MFVASTKNGSTEYYLQTETYKTVTNAYNENNNFIEIWSKAVAAKGKLTSFRKDEVDSRKRHTLSTQGYSQYQSTMTKYQFDCLNNKEKRIESVDYDNNGMVLDEVGEGEWQDVIPETIGDALLKSACLLHALKEIPEDTTSNK